MGVDRKGTVKHISLKPYVFFIKQMKISSVIRLAKYSLILLVATWLPHSLEAQTLTWDNPGVGDFNTGNNWVGGVAPQSYNSVIIADGGTAQSNQTIDVSDVTISNNSTLQLLPGLLSYLDSNQVYLGGSGIGRLVIGAEAVAGTGDVYAGYNAGATGIINVDGGTLSPFAFHAGHAGSGVVNLINDATLESTSGKVGYLAGSQGVVTLVSSTWTISEEGQPLDLKVGVQGQGEVDATNSQISALDLVIGEQLGSTGAVSLSGGNLTIQNNIYVGNMTTGSLTLTNGAHANPYELFVGNQAGSAGSLTMNGSSATISENVFIGFDGAGTFEATNPTLHAKALFLARNAGATGSATVSGGNITLTEDLHVGSGGTGNFTLTGGGALHSDIANLGFDSTATGTMSVNGGTWQNTRAIFVGVSGTGTLNIGAGGVVESESGYIAQRSGGTGAVNVNGGSWILSNTLALGVNGTAQMAISNGGQITAEWSQIGLNAGSSGTATMDNGSWTTNQTLTIGSSGPGSLTVTNGSTLAAGSIQLGATAGLSASLNVSNSTISTENILSTSVNATAELSGVEIQLRGGSEVVDTLLIDGFAPGAFVMGSGGITVNTQGGNARIPLALGGTGNFTKSGAGRLRLSAANSYSGGTRISGGVLEIEGTSALGTGNVAVESAELRAHTDATLSGNLGGGIQLISVSGNQTGVFSAATNSTLTLEPLDFLLVSGSTLQIGSSGNTGTVLFQPTGAVALPGDVAINVAAGTFQAGNDGLEFMTAIAASTTVAAGATLDFDDNLGTGGIRALYGAGTVQIGSNSSTALVVDSGNFSGNIAGNGALVKESSGTLILSGPTAFIGGTTVNAGTLIVNGSLSEGLGNVVVNSGGTLGGSGLMNGISLNGGSLSPGNSSGNLTAGELLWTTGTVLFDLGSSIPTSDLITVGTFVGLGGPSAEYEFTFLDNGWVEDTTYNLVEFTDSTFNNDASQFSFTNSGGFDGTFFFEGSTLKFTLTAIPEPTAIGLLLLAAAALLVLRSRAASMPNSPLPRASCSDSISS